MAKIDEIADWFAIPTATWERTLLRALFLFCLFGLACILGDLTGLPVFFGWTAGNLWAGLTVYGTCRRLGRPH